MFLSRGDRDIGVAFQSHPVGHASSRVEAKEETATHSSVLAWRIPGTGEPGELPSMGSHRVGHDWRDLAAAAAARLVIAFLPRTKQLLISWLQSPSAVILEPKKINSVTVSIVFPSICHEVMGPDAMIFVFWMLSVFYPQQTNFFTLHFHFQEALQFLFAFCHKGGVICISWGYWYFSWQS